MRYKIREIDTQNREELDWVTNHTMKTVLETIPEFENSEEKVLEEFPNFTFQQMRNMIQNDFPKENHCLFVIEDTTSHQLVGHSIFSLKEDENNKKYGFCYSRYISPLHRRKGLASKLLKISEEWWTSKEAEYVIAQTHESNFKLQGLFEKFAYQKSGPKQGRGYKYYLLRKDL